MSSFFSNVLKLTSGTIFAQIIGILLVPFVTRLYSPENFGIFQLFLSISSIITIFACLSYQLAIMLPKDDVDSANIVVLCVILTTVMSAVSGIIFIIFSKEIGILLNTIEISQYFVFLPLVVFLSAIFSVMTYWLSRRKQFGLIAVAQIANSVSSKTAQIGMGIYSASPMGLIIGLIVGNVVSITIRLRQIRADMALFRQVTLHNIRILAIRYKRFPIFTSWSTTANAVSTQITPMILVLFFNPAIVGYYAVAYMVVLMPMGIIGTATSQVFFQKACDEKNQTGNITNIVREIQQRLISIGMFPMFILIIIGPDLFSFVLGSQWSAAGQYAGILAPWYLLVFIASPLSTIFSVLERQTVDLTFNVLILISRVVVLVIGGIYGDPIVALVLYSATGVIFFGWMNLYILKVSGMPYREGFNNYLKFFCLGAIAVLPLAIVKLFSVHIFIIFIVAAIVSLAYYSTIVMTDPLLKSEFLKIIGGIKP
jgi:lipopolysaccharide exporter